MSFYGILRDIERAANAAERDRIRKQKQIYRIKEANRREYEKQQKKDYINSQLSEAERMTNEIIKLYNTYDNFINTVLKRKKEFYFSNFYKKYNESAFIYNVNPPLKQNNSEHIKIPKESKLENKFKFLKNRRISKIHKKDELQKIENEQYEAELKKYENEKETAKKSFAIEENKKKECIEEYNNKVESWKFGCESREKDCIDKYMAHLLKILLDCTQNKLINKIQYDLKENTLICELFMKKEREIFPCEGYRYYKQKDTIEPIQTKRMTVNTMLKEIIPNIAIAFIDILYKNDDINIFNNIIVNVYYERKCCSSIKLSKDEYANFDLNNEDSYYYVYDHYMKNYKVLTTGVKPYESIYTDLV